MTFSKHTILIFPSSLPPFHHPSLFPSLPSIIPPSLLPFHPPSLPPFLPSSFPSFFLLPSSLLSSLLPFLPCCLCSPPSFFSPSQSGLYYPALLLLRSLITSSAKPQGPASNSLNWSEFLEHSFLLIISTLLYNHLCCAPSLPSPP